MLGLRFVSQDPRHAIHLCVIVFKSLNFILRLTRTPRRQHSPPWWCSPDPCPWGSQAWWSRCSGAGARSAQLKLLRDYLDRFYFRDVTVFVHPHVDTFFQSASLTLIPMSLVNSTSTIPSLTSKQVSDRNCLLKYFLQPVNEPPSDRSLKESRAPVAREDSVMFARAGVSTHTTGQAWGNPTLTW